MKISVITISYNSAATIEDTIKSVVSQDYADLEYLVIDGKSKDNTVSIAEKFSTIHLNLTTCMVVMFQYD